HERRSRVGLSRLWPRARTAAATRAPRRAPHEAHTPVLAQIAGLSLRRGTVTALHEVDLTLRPGETVALMGRNGAGKSSLLGALVGVHAPTAGAVTVGGEARLAPSRTRPGQLLRHVGLVPQGPLDLLSADTVAAAG